MNEQKNRKWLVVVLIILLIVIISLIGFICYDHKLFFLSNSTKTESNEIKGKSDDNNSWKDIALDDPRFFSIYNTLKSFTYKNSRGAGYKDFNNYELALLGFGLADVKKTDFKNQNVIQNGDITNATFNASVVDSVYKDLFNAKIDVDFNNVKNVSLYNNKGIEVSKNYISTCGFEIKSYDNKSREINAAFNTLGCGGTSGPMPNIKERKIISAKKKKDTIVIIEKAIYYDYSYGGNDITLNIYGDNNEEDYLDTKVYSFENIESQSLTVDSYLDKASTITQTFKLNKNNNKYYFVNSIIN